MNKEGKIDSKEVGLDIGLIFARYFFKTEYMHYGLWSKGLEVNSENMVKAQISYAKFIISNIPDGVKTILDVGCGTGRFALDLINAGYNVECVSPSPHLTGHVKRILGDDAVVYETVFEHLKTDKKYDLVLFSESFQYIDTQTAIDLAYGYLNKNGHLLICDFFRRDESKGKSPIGGGHGWSNFNLIMDNSKFKEISNIDITEETSPTLDLMNTFLTNVVKPIWETIAYMMKTNHAFISKLFTWKYQKKIEKAHRKYFQEKTNAKSFKEFKRYHLLLFQK